MPEGFVALDPAFLLSQVQPSAEPPVSLRDIPELATAIDRNAHRVWPFQVRANHCAVLDGSLLLGPARAYRRLWPLLGGRWLVLDRCPLDAIDGAMLELQRNGGNGYSCLLSAGAVVVAPSAHGHLSGGSFADVQLCWTGDRVGVQKMIRGSKHLSDVDAGRRLMGEIEWLRSLPAAAASLFPQLVDTIEPERAVGYVTEFLPGYTLAEHIVDGRLTLAEASRAITFVLRALVERVYGTPLPSRQDVKAHATYLSRIKRRCAVIEAAPNGTGKLVKDLMRAEKVYVNGTVCFGLPTLLNVLSSSVLEQHIRIGNHERAHGDLILDDIVLSRRGEVRLVDPNGDARSRLYDLGKLCLSLTTCYEFFKYDLFDCEVEISHGPPRIMVMLHEHPAREIFQQLSELLPVMISESGFMDDPGHEVSGTGLMMLNGMQKLALPMFHLLRHGHESRAVAFLAIGLLRATQSLMQISSGNIPSLGDACRCIF